MTLKDSSRIYKPTLSNSRQFLRLHLPSTKQNYKFVYPTHSDNVLNNDDTPITAFQSCSLQLTTKLKPQIWYLDVNGHIVSDYNQKKILVLKKKTFEKHNYYIFTLEDANNINNNLNPDSDNYVYQFFNFIKIKFSDIKKIRPDSEIVASLTNVTRENANIEYSNDTYVDNVYILAVTIPQLDPSKNIHKYLVYNETHNAFNLSDSIETLAATESFVLFITIPICSLLMKYAHDFDTSQIINDQYSEQIKMKNTEISELESDTVNQLNKLRVTSIFLVIVIIAMIGIGFYYYSKQKL